MLYIYELTVHLTLQSVKVMTTHILVKLSLGSIQHTLLPCTTQTPIQGIQMYPQGGVQVGTGQVLLPTAIRTLRRTMALGGRVNEVGSTA